MKSCLTAALALLVLAGGCGRPVPPPQERPRLRILCGSSMAAPIQEIAREFAASHGVDIAMDTGGSETLLPKILVGASADIFVCHDPFEARVREAGRLAGSVRVGHLHPILAVQTGNPMGIRGVADLQRAGLRVGIGNPEFSTCGELFVASLRSRGSYDAVMKQIVLQSRSTTDVANGLVVGSLDAGVIWNFNAVLFTGRLEVVDAILDCPEVRVTVLGLTQSPGPRWRDAFLEWCRRPAALEAFRRHGYNRPDAPRTP